MTCLSCKIANGEAETVGGFVAKTEHFNVAQDFEYHIPGFLILASNRHFKCVDEMTDPEVSEFGTLLRDTRRTLRNVLGIEDVYYFYNEDTRHHFHLWIVPRYNWMKAFGKSIESVSPALEFARTRQMTTAETLAETIESLRASLSQFRAPHS